MSRRAADAAPEYAPFALQRKQRLHESVITFFRPAAPGQGEAGRSGRARGAGPGRSLDGDYRAAARRRATMSGER
jgi:hypothetical protein